MSNFATVILASLLPLSGAWSASALANGGAPDPLPEEFAGDLPRCEIRAERNGRGLLLEGLVFADVPLTGSYRLRISQRGPEAHRRSIKAVSSKQRPASLNRSAPFQSEADRTASPQG